MNINRLIIILLFVTTTATAVYAERLPDIEFEKTTIDLGTFSSDKPKQKAVKITADYLNMKSQHVVTSLSTSYTTV